jgi:nitroreductase
MTDILNELKNRRSIRSYTDEPVPEELLDKIIEAGLYAPTGMNSQLVYILKITDPKTVRQLGLINGSIMGQKDFDGFYGAPAVLCVLADRKDQVAAFDGSSVMSNMLNEASSLGLGCCWVHRGKEQFETEEGRAILKKAGLDPDQVTGIGNVVVGYMKGEKPQASPRKEGRVYSI